MTGAETDRPREARQARGPAGPGETDEAAAAAATALAGARTAMVVTDARAPDNPIVFANRAFLDMTGYPPEAVIGRNCRFLQGPQTDPAELAVLREGIARQETTYVEILNYRRDGRPFWNGLLVSPVEGPDGHLRYHLGAQRDVSDTKERERRLRASHADLVEARASLEGEVAARTHDLVESLSAKSTLVTELDHRVKNNLQLMLSLVSIEMRRRDHPEARAALGAILDRLQALGTVHRGLFNADEVGRFDAAVFARDLAQEVLFRARRRDLRLELDTEPVLIPAGKAAPIALVLNELIAGAIAQGYRGRRGRLRITDRKSVV